MTAKRIVTASILASILFVVQVAFAFLPNIELVSLLVILYTSLYGKKVFPIIYVFVILEGIFYGFGIWWISYLYIWSILAVAVLLLKRNDSYIFWSIISGAFGLIYGLLCTIPYFLVGGIKAGIGYWIAGIPFDIIHCVGNVAVCLVLYKPIQYVLKKIEGTGYF